MDPGRRSGLRVDGVRRQAVCDGQDASAREGVRSLAPTVHEDLELIIVVGGDGAKLPAIRGQWPLRFPSFGINKDPPGFRIGERGSGPPGT